MSMKPSTLVKGLGPKVGPVRSYFENLLRRFIFFGGGYKYGHIVKRCHLSHSGIPYYLAKQQLPILQTVGGVVRKIGVPLWQPPAFIIISITDFFLRKIRLKFNVNLNSLKSSHALHAR